MPVWRMIACRADKCLCGESAFVAEDRLCGERFPLWRMIARGADECLCGGLLPFGKRCECF